MKRIYGLFFFIGISVSAFSQSAGSDSILKPGVSLYTFRQTENINVYYSAVNSKFIIENNTKQMHNFYIGIYDLTGNPVIESRNECFTGKSIELPVELKPGLYIINIIDKTISYTKKILIR